MNASSNCALEDFKVLCCLNKCSKSGSELPNQPVLRGGGGHQIHQVHLIHWIEDFNKQLVFNNDDT